MLRRVVRCSFYEARYVHSVAGRVLARCMMARCMLHRGVVLSHCINLRLREIGGKSVEQHDSRRRCHSRTGYVSLLYGCCGFMCARQPQVLAQQRHLDVRRHDQPLLRAAAQNRLKTAVQQYAPVPVSRRCCNGAVPGGRLH